MESTRFNFGSLLARQFTEGFLKQGKESLRLVCTGDFCRATQCNFCRAKVATSISRV